MSLRAWLEYNEKPPKPVESDVIEFEVVDVREGIIVEESNDVWEGSR